MGPAKLQLSSAKLPAKLAKSQLRWKSSKNTRIAIRDFFISKKSQIVLFLLNFPNFSKNIENIWQKFRLI